MSGGVRPYQPVTPANNKYLAKRWDQEIFNTHRQKVAAARAVIDNNPPTVHMHLHIKLKKLQFEAERLATIERDNRILLEKMAHIMRTGGLVDHKKHDYAHKSLNKTKRQRELLRLTHENLAILKRLTTKDPHYNHKKWLLEWQVNQQYLMNISKYPHPWRQEQSPYVSMLQRQTKANKRINKKVHSTSPGPGKSRASGLSLPLEPASTPSLPISKPVTPVAPSVIETAPPTISVAPAISMPSTHCEIQIKTEPFDPDQDTKQPFPVTEIKKEQDAVEEEEKRLARKGVSLMSTSATEFSDLTKTVKLEDEQEEIAPIPITISQSDYQQAVNIDLPIVTPTSSPEC